MIHAHVYERGHESVTITPRMLRYWWSRLNREVFSGELLPCQLTFGPSEFKAVAGLCYPLEGGRVRIHLDPCNETRQGMLATLAHEMVHQYQHQHGFAMNHGETFAQWSEHVLGTTTLTI